MTTNTRWSRLPFAAVPLALSLALLTAAGCDDAEKQAAASLTGGDPDRGRHLVDFYGCGACHTVPGSHGADGVSAPPLDRMALRTYVAGVVKNNPQNLTRWILDPPAVDPLTAMPNVHATPQDARDIAGYLYTLR